MRLKTCLVALTLIGCAPKAADPAPEISLAGPMTPMPTPTFVAGPAVTPTGALKTWLDAQNETTMVRIPVAVAVSALGTSGGAVGTGADLLQITLSDSRLGVSLADRAREACGPEATSCALWLWGTWKDGTLSISKVEGPATADELGAGPAFSAP